MALLLGNQLACGQVSPGTAGLRSLALDGRVRSPFVGVSLTRRSAANDGPGNAGLANDGPGNAGLANDGPRNAGLANDGPRNAGLANDGPRNAGLANDGPSPSSSPSLDQRVSDIEAYISNAARGADAANASVGSNIAGPGPAHNGWMMICAALVLFMTLPGLALFTADLLGRKTFSSIPVAQCFGIAGLSRDFVVGGRLLTCLQVVALPFSAG